MWRLPFWEDIRGERAVGLAGPGLSCNICFRSASPGAAGLTRACFSTTFPAYYTISFNSFCQMWFCLKKLVCECPIFSSRKQTLTADCCACPGIERVSKMVGAPMRPVALSPNLFYCFEMKGIDLREKEPGPDGKNGGYPPLCVWGSLEIQTSRIWKGWGLAWWMVISGVLIKLGNSELGNRCLWGLCYWS